MSEKRKPWGKFYWGDWRRDARLRRCSYAARGLWIDLMCIMAHECDVYGVLTMEGEPLTASDIAGLLGGSPREIQRLLDELVTRNVCSLMGDDGVPEDVLQLVGRGCPIGAIISRRMVRDKAKEDTDRRNGREGGNPELLQKPSTGLTPQGEFGLTPPVKAQSQRSESEIRKDPPQAPRKRVAGLSASELAEFDQWYAVYPRKEARGRGEKAWRKAREIATMQELVDGAKRYAEAVRGKERQYIALPASWLNDKRWLDDRAPRAYDVSQRQGPKGPPPPPPDGWLGSDESVH